MQVLRLTLLAPLLALAAGCTSSAPGPSRSAATGTAKTTTASGIVFESMVTGSGPAPKATDKVRVHYRGTFLDGREFDSSYKRGEPAEFELNRVIKCWTEAVQLMRPGGKARIMCPAAVAYGERGAGGGAIPPNTPLNFEIELLAIVH